MAHWAALFVFLSAVTLASGCDRDTAGVDGLQERMETSIETCDESCALMLSPCEEDDLHQRLVADCHARCTALLLRSPQEHETLVEHCTTESTCEQRRECVLGPS